MSSVASALTGGRADSAAPPRHAHERRWLEAEAGTLGACLDSKISSGGYHTCAILDNAELKCWGKNNYGQLGYDSTDNKGDSAGDMASLGAVNLGAGRTAVAVSAGEFHACAILDNAELKCWGARRLRPARLRLNGQQGRFGG